MSHVKCVMVSQYNMRNKVPILLVTGFLGSGKTTFLNWLIHTHPDLKISLILNEFGDIKLESQFIKEHDGGEVAELANGCMCCVAKSDIPRIVRLILENSPQTEYIIIEASGLSDPDPIRAALQDPDLVENVRLENTLCIVDAVNFEETRDEHQIVMSQIGDADVIIISKVKEAGSEIAVRVKKFIESIGVGTKVILWDGNMHPEDFLNQQQASDRKEEKEHDHNHHHMHEKYDEYWFKSDKQIDLIRFSDLMRRLSNNIVRSKGYIYTQDIKVMVQFVAGLLETSGADWGNEKPHTAVLFLGKNIDVTTLRKDLKACEM